MASTTQAAAEAWILGAARLRAAGGEWVAWADQMDVLADGWAQASFPRGGRLELNGGLTPIGKQVATELAENFRTDGVSKEAVAGLDVSALLAMDDVAEAGNPLAVLMGAALRKLAGLFTRARVVAPAAVAAAGGSAAKLGTWATVRASSTRVLTSALRQLNIFATVLGVTAAVGGATATYDVVTGLAPTARSAGKAVIWIAAAWFAWRVVRRGK